MTARRTHHWLARWLPVAAALVGLVVLAAPARAAASEADRSSPPLMQRTGLNRAEESERVRALQRRLHSLGVGPGPVDGRFGPLTEAAVRQFQSASGLAVDGIVGPRTGEALRAGLPLARGAGSDHPHGWGRVRALQRRLRAVGARPGRIDGRFGPLTEAAVRHFQRARGLIVDGIVGPRTGRRLALVTAVRARAPQAARLPAPRPAHRPPVNGRAPSVVPAPRTRGTPPPVLAALAVVVGTLLISVLIMSLRRRRTAIPADGPTAPRSAAPAVNRPTPAPDNDSANAAPPPPERTAAAPPERTAAAPPARTAAAPPARTAAAPPERTAAARPQRAVTPRARAAPDKRSASRGQPPARGRPRPRDAPPSQPVRALGYVSVPADGPLAPASGRQARAIEAACAARGWAFVGGVREPEPVKGKAVERPGLEHALKRLQRGEANCLVVAELRRLTRSVVELGELIDRLGRAGVRLVVLDLEIDTGTEGGRMAASALATVGGWEHERVAERTRKGPPAARARGYNRHSRDTAGATGPMPGAVQTDRRTPGAVTPTGDHDAVTWTEGDAE